MQTTVSFENMCHLRMIHFYFSLKTLHQKMSEVMEKLRSLSVFINLYMLNRTVSMRATIKNYY